MIVSRYYPEFVDYSDDDLLPFEVQSLDDLMSSKWIKRWEETSGDSHFVGWSRIYLNMSQQWAIRAVVSRNNEIRSHLVVFVHSCQEGELDTLPIAQK